MQLSPRLLSTALVLLLFAAGSVRAESICEPDGVQTSGSIYRICMPPADVYNGNLVIWAHGFQDAGTPVSIPEDQLCFEDLCIPAVVNGLGFAFATNSYSKTGLAVKQGKEDILDLVTIFKDFAAQKGYPLNKVYLIGASEGGIITALAIEQHPDVFSAGLAACGPIGNFRYQINYFGNARATFEYFFPGVIPGDPFNPDPSLVNTWGDFYKNVVKPIVIDPANRHVLEQWVAVAKLPFDAANYLDTVEQSVSDVLRYSVVNLQDAAETLGGFPFDNRYHWYTGSDDDLLLNLSVIRVSADPGALKEMKKNSYLTNGVLQRPLITIHTLKDQQVPYEHERLYLLKTLRSGSFLAKHLNVPIDRYEHCNFTPGEVLFSFALMLFKDATLTELSGVGSLLQGKEMAIFERLAQAAGLPYRITGESLKVR